MTTAQQRIVKVAVAATASRTVVAGSAVLFAVLAAISDIDFRWREARLALEGDADWQIRVELLLWGLAGAFAAWRLLHDRTWLVRHFPRNMGPATQVMLVIAGVSLLSTVRGAVVLSMVRAMQLLVLVLLVAVAQRSMPDIATAAQWWTTWRRAFVPVVAALAAVSLLMPALRYDVVTHTGFSRLTLFHTHPITTGAFLGLAAVLLTGALLGLRDPWLRRPWLTVGATGAVAALLLLVLATRARGPLLATAVALTVLVAMSRDRRRRTVAVLVAGLLVAAAVGGAFDEQLYAAFVRGQSQDEILSLTGRTDLFRYAGTLIAERPVLGHGYLAARSIFLDRFPWAGESHNAYVDLAISLGIVGFVLYAALFRRIVLNLRQARARSGAGQQLAAEAWAVVSFLLVMGVIGESFAGAMGVEVVALGAVVLITDALGIRRGWLGDRSSAGTP